MGDVGVVQKTLGGNKQYNMGTVPQRVPSFLATLDIFLQSPGAVFSSIVLADRNNKEQSSDLLMAILKILGKNTCTY